MSLSSFVNQNFSNINIGYSPFFLYIVITLAFYKILVVSTLFLFGLTWSRLSTSMRILGLLILTSQYIIYTIISQNTGEVSDLVMNIRLSAVVISSLAFVYVPFLLYTAFKSKQ